MNELVHLQQNLVAALKQKNLSDNLLLQTNSRLSFQQSIAIYRQSMQAALVAVLADTYPVCEKIVGADFFQAMAQLYVIQTDSTSPNINDYGASFPQFIAEFPHVKALAYLADVARLEWLLHCVVCGEDSSPLPVAELMQLNETDYEQLVFSMPKNSYLLNSDYPIFSIWQFNKKENPEDEMLILDNQPAARLFIWRRQLAAEIVQVNDLEWRVLSALKAGITVKDLCASFAFQTQASIPELLGEFVSKSWINQFFVG